MIRIAISTAALCLLLRRRLYGHAVVCSRNHDRGLDVLFIPPHPCTKLHKTCSFPKAECV
ncbi:hypothetical protein Plhal304r1_c026g0088361 [Plasmopara halstedii]